MARTSKSRGATPFKMKSGNASPYKFLGKALGKIGGGVSKLLGGGSGAQKVGGFIGGGGLLGAAGRAVGIGGGGNTQAATQEHMQAIAQRGMVGPNLPPTGTNPMMKRENGYTPHKSASPLKTDATLVRGAYDAASGKGTWKYGQIAKSRAFSDMSGSIADAVESSANVQAHKQKRRLKKQWKTVAKHRKFVERKKKGWKDKKRYS